MIVFITNKTYCLGFPGFHRFPNVYVKPIIKLMIYSWSGFNSAQFCFTTVSFTAKLQTNVFFLIFLGFSDVSCHCWIQGKFWKNKFWNSWARGLLILIVWVDGWVEVSQTLKSLSRRGLMIKSCREALQSLATPLCVQYILKFIFSILLVSGLPSTSWKSQCVW